jgi:hypothetical protein
VGDDHLERSRRLGRPLAQIPGALPPSLPTRGILRTQHDTVALDLYDSSFFALLSRLPLVVLFVSALTLAAFLGVARSRARHVRPHRPNRQPPVHRVWMPPHCAGLRVDPA